MTRYVPLAIVHHLYFIQVEKASVLTECQQNPRSNNVGWVCLKAHQRAWCQGSLSIM